MRTCVRCPLPNAELVKALGRRDLAEAEAAARDLERVEPEHALAIVLLMGDEDDARFEPALIRWVGLWLARHPQIGFELAVDLVRALAELKARRPPSRSRPRALFCGRPGTGLCVGAVALVSAARR